MKSEMRVFSIVTLIGLLAFAGSAKAALNGQKSVCGNGPKHKVVTLTANEKVVDLGEGIKTEAWTFDGGTPGPVIEACERDTVRIIVKNQGKMAHGLDSHAFRINTANFGPVGPGATMEFEKIVETPGVFMYHCANGAVTDEHIKMGMYGVMIVYSRKIPLEPAREIVISENGVYGNPDQVGKIAPSSERMTENRPYFVLYNGSLKNDPVEVRAKELIRVYFVNAGPFTAAFHVIGTILDRAYESGNPRNVLYGIQTHAVPAGSGTMYEFTVPEAGKYLLVDHDKLAQVPNGLAVPIVAR